MANGRFEYTIGFKTDDKGLRQAQKALQDIQKLKVDSPGITATAEHLEQAKSSAKQLGDALSKSFNFKMNTMSVSKFSQELKKLDLREIQSQFQAIGPAGEAAFNKVLASSMKTNLQVKQSNSLLKKFGEALYRNVEWMVSGNLITNITKIFSQAYGFTKNLDASLNNIRIVTGKSADEMARFGREAQETAAKLGKSTTDITNASLIFYQQGLDKQEVDARTEVATKLANVSQQSTQAVADQMTAIWNGFHVGNDELERYADIMTAIAANTASNSQELAASISKVSSIANTTGVNMEQLSAMMSTVISVTRDSPETVGTAFKTIFARMDDLVEDGTDEFGVSLGRVSSHLKAMGIEILNQDGTLRNLGDTLTEVGNKWSSYSDEQQVAIAEQMGGKRQWNQVLALFDNWDKYKDALDVAKNSTGALQEQQDTYMESTAAHLQAVKTAWEGLYSEMMSSDNINSVADMFTKVIETVRGFIQALGGLKPILLSVASLMAQAFSTQIAQSIVRISDNIKVTKYNAAELAAQQELTKQYGSLESPLMQELVGYQTTMLKNQRSITPEMQQQYNSLLDARVEAERRYGILKQESDEIEQFIQKYPEYVKGGAFRDKSGFFTEAALKPTEERLGGLEQLEGGELVSRGKSLFLGFDSSQYLSYTETEQRRISALSDGIATISDRIAKMNDTSSDWYKNAYGGTLTEEAKEKLTEYRKLLEELQTQEGRWKQAIIDRDKEAAAAAQREVRNLKFQAESASKNLMEERAFVVPPRDQGFAAIKKAGSLGQDVTAEAGRLEVMSAPISKAETQIKNIMSAFNELQTSGRISQELFQRIGQEYTQLGQDIQKASTPKEIERSFESVKEKVLSSVGEEREEIEKLFNYMENRSAQAEDSEKKRIDAIAQAQKDLVDKANFTTFVDTTVRAVSSLGQVVSVLQTINNIPKIWNNENLSAYEKFLQISRSITMVLPMALNIWRTWSTMIKSTIPSLWAGVQARAAEYYFQEAGIKARAKEIMQRPENAATTMGEAAATAIANKELFAELTLKQKIDFVNKKLLASSPALKLIAIAAGAFLALKGWDAFFDRIITHSKTLYTVLQGVGPVIIGFVSYLLGGPLGLLLATIAMVVQKTLEVKKALKEQDEAQKRLNKTTDEFIKKNKELQKVIKENIAEFNRFEEVWESFKKGLSTVEELKQAFQSLAEQLGVTDDAEYQRLLRVANYTKNYAELYKYFDDKIENQRSQQEKNAYDTVDASETALQGKVTNYSGQKKAFGRIAFNDATRDWEAFRDSGMNDVLSKTGILESARGTSFLGRIQLTTGELTPQNLIQLSQYKEFFEEITKDKKQNEAVKEIAQYYLDLINTSAQSLTNIQEAYINATSISSAKKITFSEDDTEQQQLQSFREQLATQEKEAQKAYFMEYGKPMTDEQKKTLHNNILSNIVQVFPDKEEIVAQVEAEDNLELKDIFNQVAEDALKRADPISTSAQQALANLSDSEINAFKRDLEKNDIDILQLDTKSLNYDTELLVKIIKQRGKLYQEDIDKIKEYHLNTQEVVQALTQDYDTLIASYDTFNKKVEKGTFTAKTFNSKAFQEFFTDDVKNELIELYGATSEIGQAVEIVSNKAIVGSKKWVDAWKIVGKALKDAEIEQDVENAQTALDNITNSVESFGENGEVHIFAGLSVEEAEDQLDEFINAQRTIDIDVNVRAEAETDAINKTLSDVQKLGDKIDENLQVSAEDFMALEKEFPNIGDGMQILADGTIQLSQTAVDEAKRQQKEAIAAAVDEQIAKIEIEKTLLEEKKKAYQEAAEKAAEISAKAANGQYKNEEALQDDLDELNNKYAFIQSIADKQKVVNSLELSTEEIKVWKGYYDTLTSMDAEYNKERIHNANQITEGGIHDQLTDDSGKPRTATSFYTADYQAAVDAVEDDIKKGKVAISSAYGNWQKNHDEYIAQIKADWEKKHPNGIIDYNKVKEYADASKKSAEDAIEDLDEQIEFASNTQKRLARIKTLYSNQAAGWGVDLDKKKDKDATDKATKANKSLIDALEQEIDIYHELNLAIEDHERHLKRLQNEQKRLTGKDLTKNLQEQLETLQKLNNTYNQKLDVMTTDVAVKKALAEEYGFLFDENDNVSNYQEILQEIGQKVSETIDWYNSLEEPTDEDKQVYEAAKDRLDDAEKALEAYEKQWKEYHDLTDTIEENLDQQIELQIQISKIDLEFKLSEAEKKRNRLEFQQYMQDLAEEDIVGNITYSIANLKTYFDAEGDIQQLIQQYQKLLEEKAKIDAGSISAIYGDNLKQLEEDLDDTEQKLMDAQKAAEEIRREVRDSLIKEYDQAAEKLDDQRSAFQQISDILEHDIELLKLRFGENAYSKISNLLEQQRKLTEEQLQVAVAQRNYFAQELQQALQNDPLMESDTTKALVEKYKEAVEQVGDYAQQMAEKLFTIFENTTNDLFASFMEKVSGTYGLDAIQSAWDRVTAGADMYLDTVNSVYEIDKYRLQLEKAINETDDPATQKRLITLMNEQLGILQSREKLSQYDVDRANALFEIEMKRAAFQEAQNNKSKMRLRRDASGNYSYQFVSDEDQTADAIQALADAQKALYDIDKEAFKSNAEDVQKLLSEMQEALIEDARQGGKQREEIEAHYMDLIAQKVQDNEYIRQNLIESTFAELSKYTDKNIEEFNKLTEAEQEAFLVTTNPLFGTGLIHALEPSQEFVQNLQEMLAEFDNVSDSTMAQMDNLTDIVGRTWEEMEAGSRSVVTALTDITLTTEEVVKGIAEATEKLKEFIALLGDPQGSLANNLSAIADEFTQLIFGYGNGMGLFAQIADDTNKTLKEIAGGQNSNAATGEESPGTSSSTSRSIAAAVADSISNASSTQQKYQSFTTSDLPKVGDRVVYLGGTYYENSYGGGRKGNRGDGLFGTVKVEALNPKAPYPIAVSSTDSAYGWLKPEQIGLSKDIGFAAGETNIPQIHTDQIRDSVMQSSLDLSQRRSESISAQSQIVLGIAQQTQHLMSIEKILNSLSDLDKTVNVYASFPNATSTASIEQAFINLPNIITQKTFSTLR